MRNLSRFGYLNLHVWELGATKKPFRVQSNVAKWNSFATAAVCIVAFWMHQGVSNGDY